jgi:hypothetical protein
MEPELIFHALFFLKCGSKLQPLHDDAHNHLKYEIQVLRYYNSTIT